MAGVAQYPDFGLPDAMRRTMGDELGSRGFDTPHSPLFVRCGDVRDDHLTDRNQSPSSSIVSSGSITFPSPPGAPSIGDASQRLFPPAMPRVNRNSNPCDGCTLRRVKCEAGRPCYECTVRGIECTTLRTRQKRGPKGGPRVKTRQKVEDFQRSIRQAQAQAFSDVEVSNVWPDAPIHTEPVAPAPAPTAAPPDHHGRLPLSEYCRFISIFRQRVFAIWPVINSDDLPTQLKNDPNDYESYALAAALCASTIAQLRLPEHTTDLSVTSSLRFAHDCLKMRDLYDYRETHSLSSVLIPFFLHVYYANSDKLRTAGYFLREAVTFVHALELGRPDTYAHLPQKEQSIRLRLYWLLLVTER